MDLIFATLKKRLKEEFDNTLIVTLTEFGRTIKQNSGLGTEHGYGSAIFMGGGLLKKNQVFAKIHFSTFNLVFIFMKKLICNYCITDKF